MRLFLQILLVVLALIPLSYGTVNLIGGAQRFLPSESVTTAIDSQFRFQSAWYLGLAGIIFWIVPRIERERVLFTIIILSLFLGGLGRAWSWVTLGPPPPGGMQYGMVLELLLPLLLPLQTRLERTGTERA